MQNQLKSHDELVSPFFHQEFPESDLSNFTTIPSSSVEILKSQLFASNRIGPNMKAQGVQEKF